MRQHGWYAARGNSEILFETSVGARWAATWRAEGIDPSHLVGQTGRA
jgi:putative transcriptional regulator